MERKNMMLRVGFLMVGLGLLSLLAPTSQAALIFHEDLDDAAGLTPTGSGQTFVPGVLGNALSLDGNGYYETGYTPPAMGSTNRTVSIWVNLNTTAGTWSSIMQFGVDGGNTPGEDWAMQVTTDTVTTSIELGKARGKGADGDILADSWQLITYTLDDTTLDGATLDETALYINGQIATYAVIPSGQGSKDVNTLATTIKFGNTDTVLISPQTISNWNGLLDDVSIWDTALTANEIVCLYGLGSKLGYNAGDFESMRGAYDLGVSVTVKGTTWDFSTEMIGEAAGLNLADNRLVINAADGTGMVVPEPATMSLLAIGGVVLLKRRKK
jgi:hypothetical protein